MVSRSLLARRRSRADLCLAVAGFLVTLAAVAFAQDVARTFLKGPYVQAPGTDTMTIMWESPTNRPGVVHYGLKGKLDHEWRCETPRELIGLSSHWVTNIDAGGKTIVTEAFTTNLVFLYELPLTNLRPDSVYNYSAETDGVRTPPRKFRTFGAHPYEVTFIAYGDSRSNPKTHAAIAANFKRHSPDFILHAGDMVADGRRYDLWGREFFGPLAQVIDEVPILPAIGNHEQDGTNYLQYVRLPRKERWYSYDVGPMHVVSLDFHFEKETDEQFAFARQDLMAAKAPWKIVFLHYPVFNIGGHGTGWGHAAYLPLFHRAEVDLVIAGHSHIYERFRPVASASGPDTWPITHITTGGGGAPLYPSYPHPALAAKVTTNHFLVIEATPTRLKGRALTTNETVIDKFELKKRDGQPAAKYLAQVYPEETLKLSFDAVPMLTASLNSVPTTTSSAQVMFSIGPLKNSQQPVILEIKLAPNSAPYYEIEDGPLRVTTPSATEPGKVVWTRLRATGKQKTAAAGTDRVLSPALIFQAKLVAGTVETVAYGQKCKVTASAAEAAKKLAESQPSR